jgi:hypothetical protein
MRPEEWQQVQALFNQAVALAPPEREAWLEEVCGGDSELREEVRALLAGHQAELRFEGRQIPRRIGPYELLEEIGRGGMGSVYKAQRADEEVPVAVAIKLVRPGMDTEFLLSRFRRERQALARLSHPNIARLLDGGTTESGIPYIVMEYINGAWITEHCRALSLPVRERVRLFLPVCSAVDYAHRNFVIHRDLKPGNILIDTTGAPKLLDFGLCKLLHTETPAVEESQTRGWRLLTPDYASPEQVLGEAISPSSDVYSLAVVLYELLAERPAHRVEKYTPVGIEEAICRREIALPSVAAVHDGLSRQLKGDLDNILMRALQKDPSRRYESAAAFAQDLERYLHDLPVMARPETHLYRARKFVKRHRLLVGATTSVVLALGIGVGVAWQQTQIAREHARQARDLVQSSLFDAQDALRELPGATRARQVMLDAAVRYLDTLAATNPTDPDQWRDLASGYRRVGDLHGGGSLPGNSGRGDPTAALASYRKSLTYLDKLLARDPGDQRALADREAIRSDIDSLETSRP